MSTAYCTACGEEVETFSMLQVHYKPPVEEVCCAICGMTIEDALEDEKISGGAVMIAEDSQMLRLMIQDVIENQGIADRVIACSDGAKLIKEITEMAIEKVSLKLMILDISMPVLNGVNAAIAIRSIEEGFKVSRTPIVFFTAHKCDDRLKKILNYCKPALYINKGAVSRPDELTSRIQKVIQQVLRVKKKMEGKAM